MASFWWGIWNGICAWPLLIIHAFGGLRQFAIYDVARNGGWYQLGFLLGSGSPLLGILGRGGRRRTCAPPGR